MELSFKIPDFNGGCIGSRRKQLLVFFSILLAWAFISVMPCYGEEQKPVPTDKVRIVCINSYQSGFFWTDTCQKGIGEFLADKYGSRLYLDVEFLHGKRYSKELKGKLGENILDSWAIKYPKGTVELLLVSDQDAYDLVKRAKLERGLFKDVPMVFASVEDPGDIPPLAVGILGAVDIRSNIELILKVMPETRRIWCVTDSSTTGMINCRRIQKLAANYYNQVDISFFNYGCNLSDDELIKRAGKISYPEVILFIDHATGKNGVVDTLRFLEKLSASAGVPVFSYYDQYLEHGVTGGNVFGGRILGRQIAKIGTDILSGIPVDKIPPQHEQIQPMFDYNKLKKFHVDTSRLPEKSIIINRPYGIWHTYGFYIIGAVVFMFFETYLILYLLFLIRQQRRLREETKIAAERFRTLFDMAPIPMALAVKNGAIRMNYQFTEILGYTLQDIPTIDRWWFLAYPEPEYRAMARSRWSAAVDRIIGDNQVLRSGEYVITCKDGSKKTMMIVSSGYQEELIVCFIDLTERIKAEAELKRANTLLSAQQESSIDGILLVDENGKVLYYNHRFCQIWGISDNVMKSGDDEASLKIATSLTADPKVFLSKVEFLYAHKELKSQDEILLKDGRVLERYSTPLQAEDDTYYGRLWFFRDITERKKSEVERIELQEQLTHAQKMESVGRLAGGVAHDFNNMLGVILGYTDIVMNGIDSNSPLYSKLAEVKNAAERSAALTRQLLAFARKQTVNPETFDLNKTVSSLLKMLRRLIGENIELVWNPGCKEAIVRIDPSQLDQILANLCVNSRDAINGTGQIRIRTYNTIVPDIEESVHQEMKNGKYVVLEIKDSGCGMGPEVLEHIFEPFYTTKEIGQGTGLGLATVYGIVRQSNGFISVSSEPGDGTIFKIYFPFRESGCDESVEEVKSGQVKSGFETVLLVEDEPMLLSLNEEFLLDIGYNVIPAGNPGEAIRIAGEYNNKIDLLLTDVVMPVMNGKQLAEKLTKRYPDMKVLFMSGYTANVIIPHGIDEEEVNFIKKPFSCSELAEKLREILDRNSS